MAVNSLDVCELREVGTFDKGVPALTSIVKELYRNAINASRGGLIEYSMVYWLKGEFAEVVVRLCQRRRKDGSNLDIIAAGESDAVCRQAISPLIARLAESGADIRPYCGKYL